MSLSISGEPGPRLEFRVLGGLDLRRAGAGALEGVLSQPKRLALLTYLVLATPRGFRRRDVLLALFWPEADTERARGSLRAALYFLRRALGDGVLVSRGGEEVGLAEGAIWCDAVAFEDAVEAGRLEEALELYRGDLLPGYHAVDAPEWGRWLEGERERLRRRAEAAAWMLSERAELLGDPARAVSWARRAVSLAPDDEDPHRRLLSLLDRLGDRAAAMRAHEEFARRLYEEYELEPSLQTRLLVESIRFKHEHDAPPAQEQGSPAAPPPRATPLEPATVEMAPVDPAPLELTAEADPREPARALPPPERGPRPVWRRRWAAALAGLIMVLAGAGLWWKSRKPAAAADGATRVAVLPFAVRGTSEWAYLSDGMADLLSAKLDGAGSLYSVDPRALLGTLEAQGGVLDPVRARALVRPFGPDLFVLGSVVSEGSVLHLQAALYEADPARSEPLARASVEGPPSELPRLVDGLATRLLAGRLRRRADQLHQVAALTTRSLPALKAYLTGVSSLRAGYSSQAADALSRAVAEDSGFALAWYQLSVAQQLGGEPSWQATAAEALRHADRLPAPYRLMASGWAAYGRLRYAEAERWYRAAVQARPRSAEAWEQLAEMIFHGGPQRGLPATESRHAWYRALALAPDNVNAVVHLARLAARADDREALDSLTRRALELNPDGDRSMELLALRGVALDDEAAMRQALREVRAASDFRVWVVVNRVLENSDEVARARPLAEVLTDPVRPPRTRAIGHAILAQMELARGRWSAAAPELAAAAALHPVVGHQAYFTAAALPFVPVPTRVVDSLRVELERRRGVPNAPPDASALEVLEHKELPELRLYQLGMLAARRGDTAGAERLARRLESLRVDSTLQMPASALADAVRAHAAWVQGQPAAGLEAMRTAWRASDGRDEAVAHMFSLAHPRFVRAELLRAAGQDAEALRWYASVPEDLDLDVVYRAPVHLHRAEILDRAGRAADALRHYRRFLQLWDKADPALQPAVARVRRRVDELD